MEDQLNTDNFYNAESATGSGHAADQQYEAESQADLQINQGSNSHNSSSGNMTSAAASANATAESEQMKVFVTNPNVTYHTRHARRIYVGGIPPNYSDEEELRNFFNKAISKGLDVENDNSYVISVYMNQKKCYAFVEFNSIELTTACLEMDGIIFKKVTLKIYRANEYRPELVPPTKFIKLDLSSWSFGLATGAGAGSANNAGNSSQHQPSSYMARPDRGTNGGFIAPHSSWRLENEVVSNAAPECLAALIRFANIVNIEPGSLVIVGYPYESTTISTSPSKGSPKQPAPHRGAGTAASPGCLRKSLSAYPCGAICNAELGLDLAEQPIIDVGDVLAGQSRSETQALLSTTISELLLRGSVPFLVGGTRDQTYHSAMGLVAAAGVCVGVMNLSAQVDCTILDNQEFCNPNGGQMSPSGHMRPGVPSPQRGQNCFGRYVQFGAQGAQCNAEAAKSITERGGHIFWLHRDLRTASTESVAVAQFSRALRNLDACVVHDQQRKGVNTAAMRASYPQSHIMVSVDCGVLSGAANPLGGSSHSSVGLTAEEVLEIAFLAGAHPNVALFELTEFRPDQESESRLNLFLADVFYKFALGVASRTQAPRGGVQGAGAAAVLSGNAQAATINLGAGMVASNPPVPPHYTRSPNAVLQNTALNKNNTRVAVPYAPSRDPQLQQQQQQGRGVVFAPQQLQQPQLSARPVVQQRGGMTPFATIPENATVILNNGAHRPLLKQYSAHNGSFSLHEEDAMLNDHHHHQAHGQSHSHGHGQGQGQDSNHGPGQAQGQGQMRQTRHSSYDNDDSTLSTPLFGRSNSNNPNSGAASRQTSQQSNFNDSMYNVNANLGGARPSNTTTNNNNINNNAHNNSNPYHQHGMQQMNNSFTNNNNHNNALNSTLGLSNLNTSHANAAWMSAHQGGHAHATAHTPSSLVTASQAYTPSSDWLNPNLSSRLSSHSTSTMSMFSNFRSTSSNLHVNTPSHSLSNLNSLGNSSFLLSGSSNLDDPMDKLIGVTNIGLVPAFDDPHDPLYGED